MTMMHAENGIAIDVLKRQAIAKGNTDPVFTVSLVHQNSRVRRHIEPCNAKVAGDARCTSFTSRHLMLLKRLPGPVIVARTCLRRLSAISLVKSGRAPCGRALRANGSVRLRSDHLISIINATFGQASKMMTWRSCQPITVRFA